MIRSEGINVYDILNHEHLILLEPSVKKLREHCRHNGSASSY